MTHEEARVTEVLIAAFGAEEDAEVRQAIVSALGILRAQEALGLLMETLAEDSGDERMNVSIVTALEMITGDKEPRRDVAAWKAWWEAQQKQ